MFSIAVQGFQTPLAFYLFILWLGVCVDTRRSVSSYCLFYRSCLISWKTKKHVIVTRFLAKAEYRALAVTISEVLWVSYLIKDFELKFSNPIHLFCDNKLTIQMFLNPKHHERTKYIESIATSLGIMCNQDLLNRSMLNPSTRSQMFSPKP